MASADFLGTGWNFPVTLNQERRIKAAAGAESIQQSIWIILATAPGERVMRPDFGCGLHELVFAINDAMTLGRVIREVREALIRWEPRIDVLDIGVETKDDGEVLLINISYRVRSTNNLFNLVYPFYLVAGPQ